MFVQIQADYSLGDFLFDAILGAFSLVIIFLSALALGGYDSSVPWIIVTVLTVFGVGFIRGRGTASIWVQSIAIGAGPTLLLLVFGGDFHAIFSGITLFAAFGVRYLGSQA
jgi:hypothetical protein